MTTVPIPDPFTAESFLGSLRQRYETWLTETPQCDQSPKVLEDQGDTAFRMLCDFCSESIRSLLSSLDMDQLLILADAFPNAWTRPRERDDAANSAREALELGLYYAIDDAMDEWMEQRHAGG